MREPLRRALTSDAAIRVISRDGIGAASLRRIAKEAGVPLSSLNHVYPSKEDLLKDAWNRSYQLVLDIIEEVAETRPPNLEKAVSSLILTFVVGTPSVEVEEPEDDRVPVWNVNRAQYELYLWAVQASEGSDRAFSDYTGIILRIEELFNSYETSGIDVQLLSELVIAMIDGLVLQTMSGKSIVAIQKRIDRIVLGLISSCSD
ncbi:TetR/AcrR family transcriptional regulator [Nocardia rhamnosiphila]|uniref:TetR/AcrR family transcriptional regulator n=1 Tax=Nocardia rhamnosiphila TaxID=426716 RepID=UPI0033C36D69